MCASHKDALIAVKRAEGAAVPALAVFQPAQMRMTLVKLAIERAADAITIVHRIRERLQMRFGQN